MNQDPSLFSATAESPDSVASLSAHRPSGDSPAADTASVVASQDVLRGQKSVAISHNGALYRLQTTRQGKLILTK